MHTNIFQHCTMLFPCTEALTAVAAASTCGACRHAHSRLMRRGSSQSTRLVTSWMGQLATRVVWSQSPAHPVSAFPLSAFLACPSQAFLLARDCTLGSGVCLLRSVVCQRVLQGGLYGILYAIGKPLPFPEARPWKMSKRLVLCEPQRPCLS